MAEFNQIHKAYTESVARFANNRQQVVQFLDKLVQQITSNLKVPSNLIGLCRVTQMPTRVFKPNEYATDVLEFDTNEQCWKCALVLAPDNNSKHQIQIALKAFVNGSDVNVQIPEDDSNIIGSNANLGVFVGHIGDLIVQAYDKHLVDPNDLTPISL